MKTKSMSVLLVLLSTVALIVAGCSSTKTVTQPGITTTIPATTIKLPATTVFIPQTVVVVPPVTLTPQPPPPTTIGFLSTTPITIGAYSNMVHFVNALIGQCLACHGPGLLLQAPFPPTWDGGQFGSPVNPGVYIVVPGSIQDHTPYTAAQCITCHTIQPPF